MTDRTSRIWARRAKPKTRCSYCHQSKAHDLRNTHPTRNDLIDYWVWVCRRCTMRLDGRMSDLITRNKSRPKAATKPKTGPRRGDNCSWWKGDAVSYKGAHQRVSRARGKPSLCEACGTTNAKRFDWANVNGKYADIDDYVRLCRSCHASFDGKINTLRRNPKIMATSLQKVQS